MLIHGYPQTRRCWDQVGELLADRFQVISFDLRGYGESAKPAAGPQGEGYSKREMATDVLAVLDHFDLGRAHLVGHDRGGRLAYRSALDHPQRFRSLAVLDILPTVEQFERLSGASALGTYHWWFLAQPGGLPERLITAEAGFYLRHCIASWWGRSVPMDEDDLAHYVDAFTPEAVVGSCADYRCRLPPGRADRPGGPGRRAHDRAADARGPRGHRWDRDGPQCGATDPLGVGALGAGSAPRADRRRRPLPGRGATGRRRGVPCELLRRRGCPCAGRRQPRRRGRQARLTSSSQSAEK